MYISELTERGRSRPLGSSGRNLNASRQCDSVCRPLFRSSDIYTDIVIPACQAQGVCSSWDLLVAGPSPVSSTARCTGAEAPRFLRRCQNSLLNVFAHLHEFPTCTRDDKLACAVLVHRVYRRNDPLKEWHRRKQQKVKGTRYAHTNFSPLHQEQSSESLL